MSSVQWVFLTNLMVEMLIGHVKMMLEWSERENKDMDMISMGYRMTLNDLRRCRLLKFYHTSNMRAHVRLLEALVHLWDHKLGMFDLQGETLDLTVEDTIFYHGFVSSRGTCELRWYRLRG